MTSKEKFLKLIKNNDNEKLTLFMPILMHFAARFINKKYSDFAGDYKVLVESNIKCMEAFNADAVGLISDPYRETSAFGATITFPDDNVPKCEKPIILNADDVKRLRIPDVYKCERTLDRIKGAMEYKKILRNDIPIIGWIEGPLAEACDLAGVSEMLLNLSMEEDFSYSLLEKTTVMAKNFAKAQIDAGCDIIGIGDAICSQISSEMFVKYEKVILQEIIDFIHENNAFVKLHICGNITHLLNDIKNIKPDIVDIDWMVDMNEAYKVLGEDIIRCGNLNPVAIIEQMRAEEVFKQTKGLCVHEKGKKIILSGGCEITVNTPHENLKAMSEALKSL